MKFFKLLVLSILISSSLFLSTTSFAQSVTTTKTTTPVIVDFPAAPKPTTLATVNIVDYKITSQKNNTFNISFVLSNGVGVQSGVKYGVQLLGSNTSGQYIADEKVYSDSLSLSENSNLPKSIVYTAPSMLSGSYDLFLVSKNESGFPFAQVSLGKVTLKSSSGLEIIQSSCFIQVVGEKNEPHYNAFQTIDIVKNETLRLTCNAKNSTNKNLSVKPFFETFNRTSYGSVAPQVGGDTQSISFKSKEQKSFFVKLPISEVAQLYNMNIKLEEGNIISNTVNIEYLLHGVNATIVNLSLDKDGYLKGDKAILSLVYSSLVNNLEGGRVSTNDTLSNFVVKATITNKDGQECMSPISKNIIFDIKNSILEIPISITTDCINPKTSISISDDNGNTLDQKDFLVTTSGAVQASKNSGPSSLTYLYGIILVAGIAFYLMKMRKK